MAVQNNCSFIGNLGDDPVVRTINDKEMAEFSLCVEGGYAGRDKEKPSYWINVTVWNSSTAKYVGDYLNKGDKVAVQCEFQPGKYTDKNGIEKKSHKFIVGQYDGSVQLVRKKGEHAHNGPQSFTDASNSNLGGNTADVVPMASVSAVAAGSGLPPVTPLSDDDTIPF